MTQKPWLESYDQGVPQTIDPNQYSSLVEIYEKTIEKYSKNQAFTNMGKQITFRELGELSQNFAGFLQTRCQCVPGDRIAIMMPNTLQYPIAMFGILQAKMTVVNVNPLYTVRELHHILQDSGAKVIIVLENFAHVVEQALMGTAIEQVIISQLGDLLGCIKGSIINFAVKHIKKMVPPYHLPSTIHFKECLKPVYHKQFTKIDIIHEDIAFLQYTGGTTGVIKGAILTHRNMVANALQTRAWLTPIVPHLTSGILTALPLYHIFSLLANCITCFSFGLNNILITNPRDIPNLIKDLSKNKFCLISGVNTLFNALLHNDKFKDLDFSHLVFSMGGGMAIEKKVADNWQQITGLPIAQAYGLTEASPAVTINPVTVKTYTGSIGLPISSTDVKFCDDDGKEVALGEKGELWVKGPQVMRGYWNQHEETQRVLTEDGWLKTGDIGYMDPKGFIYLVDRKKDVIIVSGFNVFPHEVEDVIAELKLVHEVAVIGIPSELHGEVVKAFIVPESPDLTKEMVLEHCKAELTGYKIPKEIEFRTELPKSNVGKILNRVLREEEAKKRG